MAQLLFALGQPLALPLLSRTRTELLDKTWSCSALSHTQPFLPQAPPGPSHPHCPQAQLPLFLQGLTRLLLASPVPWLVLPQLQDLGPWQAEFS